MKFEYAPQDRVDRYAAEVDRILHALGLERSGTRDYRLRAARVRSRRTVGARSPIGQQELDSRMNETVFAAADRTLWGRGWFDTPAYRVLGESTCDGVASKEDNGLLIGR